MRPRLALRHRGEAVYVWRSSAIGRELSAKGGERTFARPPASGARAVNCRSLRVGRTSEIGTKRLLFANRGHKMDAVLRLNRYPVDGGM